MSDFEQCSNRLQLDIISLLVNFLLLESQLYIVELSGRKASCFLFGMKLLWDDINNIS